MNKELKSHYVEEVKYQTKMILLRLIEYVVIIDVLLEFQNRLIRNWQN